MSIVDVRSAPQRSSVMFGKCREGVGVNTRQVSAKALIFDLDGVLVDSRAAVDAAWTQWGDLHSLPREVVLRTIPGMRTRDAVSVLAPKLDADIEAASIVARELELVHFVTPIVGAAELLALLPRGRWGIATSGTDAIARSRLAQAGLPLPEIFVTAQMVINGKPDPEVYLHAAAALGVVPADCLVFEDAPPGIEAADSAGCPVVGVLTWAERKLLKTPLVISDFRDVEVSAIGARISLRLTGQHARGMP